MKRWDGRKGADWNVVDVRRTGSAVDTLGAVAIQLMYFYFRKWVVKVNRCPMVRGAGNTGRNATTMQLGLCRTAGALDGCLFVNCLVFGNAKSE